MDSAVALYQDLIKHPEVSSAVIVQTENGGNVVIETVQTQRDLEREEKIKFAKSYIVQVENNSFSVLCETGVREVNNEVWNKTSKSGKYQAIVRKVLDKKKEDKFFLEIWSKNSKIHNIDLLAAEKHGKPYENDGCLGCFEWSASEGKILYVAEKKYKKAVSYFAKQPKDDEKKNDVERGEEFVFKEDWGEQFVGKHYPVLCMLDIATGEITVVEGVPDSVSPGLARWTPGDEGLVFTGWQHEPYRLGLIYCPMRKSTIFHLNLQTGKCDALSSTSKSSRNGIFSPTRDCFVYLQNEIGGPHQQCCTLWKYDWKTQTNTAVVDLVTSPEGDQFPGLYAVNLPDSCWSSDGVRIMATTVWRSKEVTVIINTQTKVVTRLPTVEDCCMSGMCVQNDLVVAQCSSPCRPNFLVFGHLPPSGQESSIQWQPLGATTAIEGVAWKVFKHQPTSDRVNEKCPQLGYESILVYPTDREPAEPKTLLLFPHGGPHSVFVSRFMLYVTGFCKLGFSSLMVNYRGSVGFGNDSIYCLPGKCGVQDVNDCQSAVEEVIQKEGYDAERVCVWGGSHGGFLTCHLIGQYPDFYKAAVTRNPVINIASKLGNSDFPDGCCVESGLPFDHTTIPNAESLAAMWKRSPLQYVDQIKTPLMILIGLDDRRCPPKQSYEMYKALKSRGKTVRYITYPDNCHPIVKVDSEADAFINMFKWFLEYLPNVAS